MPGLDMRAHSTMRNERTQLPQLTAFSRVIQGTDRSTPLGCTRSGCGLALTPRLHAIRRSLRRSHGKSGKGVRELRYPTRPRASSSGPSRVAAVQDAEKNSHHGEALQAVSSGGRRAAIG